MALVTSRENREGAKRLLPADIAKTNLWIDHARAAGPIGRAGDGSGRAFSIGSGSSQAIADEMELGSREAAAFFAREQFIEQCRAEADPAFALELEIRAERGLELRRLREKREDRELMADEARTQQASLMEMFEGYAGEAGARPATIDGFRSHIRSFIEHTGIEDAGRIELRHVIGWIDWLRTKPGKRGATLSERTIRNSYLAALRLTLAYGVTKLTIRRNVMADLKLMKVKKPKLLRERHFNQEERQKILSAALAPSSPRLSDHINATRRWLPWLCAYSGARVGEVLQLRKSDVRMEDGVWAMHLTPMAGELKTNQQRWVPIHEHLIELGFLAWVEAQAFERLFYRERPEGAPSRRSPPYQSVYNRFREWVREHVPDPDVQPCHGWRHTFKSLARDYDMNSETVDVIQGHSPATVGKTYGATSMAVRLRELSKLPRFEIPS